jgi:hypothetical protein
MDKKYGYVDWPTEYTRFETFLDKLEDAVQSVYNVFNWAWFDRRTQKVKVRIDRQDTWSMDHTLAHIILPMLKQLKETKHGAPYVDPKDVPKELQPKKQTKKQKDNGETDSTHFERWDWVLDEMIWSFEQKTRDDWEGDYYKYDHIEPNKESEYFSERCGMKLVWEDREGCKAHQERMTNGFRLFGKYFESLWD